MTTTNPAFRGVDALKRTPVSRPQPGRQYEHLRHGVVEVRTVEDGMVVFDRAGGGYINTRQQPVAQFRAQTIDIR